MKLSDEIIKVSKTIKCASFRHSCIYFLIDTRTGEVLYIGRSKEKVLARAGVHERDKQYEQLVFLAVDPGILNDAELAFIRFYRPTYNTMGTTTPNTLWDMVVMEGAKKGWTVDQIFDNYEKTQRRVG